MAASLVCGAHPSGTALILALSWQTDAPGRPPDEWMRAGHWVQCTYCNKLLSDRVPHGMHRRCWVEHANSLHLPQVGSNALPSRSPDISKLEEMPSLFEISEAVVLVRDFLEPALLAIAEKEFLKCVSNVVLHNDTDAWAYLRGVEDTDARKRSRMAWLELWMFSKTCLPHLPGEVAKSKRNQNRILTRLERWAAGERGLLWQELPRLVGGKRRIRELAAAQAKERRHQRAIAFDQHGMPGRAVNALVSAGLAPDSQEVEDIMRSKFPSPPSSQAASRRPQAPPSNVLSEESIAKAAAGFAQGTGAGPSGTRPDFIRQVLGKKGNKSGITPITALCNLTALCNSDHT